MLLLPDAEDTCVSLNWMIRRLIERVPSGVVVISLDACRSNAADSTFRSMGGGEGTGGLDPLVAGMARVRSIRRARFVRTLSARALLASLSLRLCQWFPGVRES